MGDLSANPVAIGTTQRPHISSRPRLDNLTTIRFFAAIHVVFAHFLGPVFTSMPVLAKAVSLGYYAVSIFYVLSGFVLLYGYSDRTGKLRGTKTGFWIGRFSRIYPAYFLAFLLSIPGVIGFIRQNSSWAPKAAKASVAAGSYLLMVQAWFPRLSVWWNFPGWSVSVEAFFYLCFPFLLVRVGRCEVRQCKLLIWGSWLVSVSIYFASQLVLNLDSTPTLTAGFGFNPLLRVPTFLTGMAIGRMFFLRRKEFRTSAKHAVLSIACCCLAMALSLLLPQHTLRDTVIAPVFAYLIYSLALDRSFVAKVLSFGPLVLLGDASYAVYILQSPVHYLCALFLKPVTPWNFGAYIVILIVASLCSFKFIEEPLRRSIPEALRRLSLSMVRPQAGRRSRAAASSP